jgi:hypothetical protein
MNEFGDVLQVRGLVRQHGLGQSLVRAVDGPLPARSGPRPVRSPPDCPRPNCCTLSAETA